MTQSETCSLLFFLFLFLFFGLMAGSVLTEWGSPTPFKKTILKKEFLNYNLGRLERRLAGKITCHIAGVAEMQVQPKMPKNAQKCPKRDVVLLAEPGCWRNRVVGGTGLLAEPGSGSKQVKCPLTDPVKSP